MKAETRKTKNGKEIDLLVLKGMTVTELYQVCYNPNDKKTKEREITALLEGMKEFKLRTETIITNDYEAEEMYEHKKIVYIPLWKWLLGG